MAADGDTDRMKSIKSVSVIFHCGIFYSRCQHHLVSPAPSQTLGPESPPVPLPFVLQLSSVPSFSSAEEAEADRQSETRVSAAAAAAAAAGNSLSRAEKTCRESGKEHYAGAA